METAAWAFVGTLVGALASISTTLLSSWNTFRIQKLSASESRTERSRAFQRDTVLELQNELLNYIRLISLAHMEDLHSCHKVGKWGAPISDEIDDKIRVSNGTLLVLIERLINDELRHELQDLKTLAGQCLLARSKDDSELYMKQTEIAFSACNEKLGIVLRNNY